MDPVDTAVHPTYTNLDRATTPLSPLDPLPVGHGPVPDLLASPPLAPKFTSSIPFRPLSLKGKEKEVSVKEPLSILDLPVDILREIIAHLPHANDLTSLALAHSVLHSLAIPCIYSRFDIVWPDQGTQADSRAGVDALTYGLATLVKSHQVFGETGSQQRHRRNSSRNPNNPFPLKRRRMGNFYAQYTKKFSLGNGPADCVREYLITKEGGKMLGTLVALAVARMVNLETFVWDMPTGVLRDVWLALSSLDDRDDDEDCRLDKVWVRWHNNWQADVSDGPPIPPVVPPPNIGIHHNSNNAAHTAGSSLPDTPLLSLADRVEHPSFSVLPAMKSLTVLEIDELQYLDEMAILIARSQHKLKELRVGIAHHARQMDWLGNWDGSKYQQVDHNTTWTIASSIGDRRLQGVLGVLVGRIHNLKNNAETSRSELGMEFLSRVLDQQNREEEVSRSTPAIPPTFDEIIEAATTPSAHREPSSGSESSHQGVDGIGRDEVVSGVSNRPLSSSSSGSSSSQGTNPSPTLHPSSKHLSLRPARPLRPENKKSENIGPYLDGVLRLETLELERVPISMPVMRQAFDFTTISNLTLLNCQHHEVLWKSLRSRYGPIGRRGSVTYKLSSYGCLKLRKIHTNTVSMALLTFIREALKPNTLETIFFQDCLLSTMVNIMQIFKYVIKRHSSSLRKILIDSGDSSIDNFLEPSARWRRWRLNRHVVAFLTSGKMRNLRELAVSLEYSDWHIFLQRLPRIPHLRSLYIPHLADHPHGAGVDMHELAMQIVDIVTLCPDIQLCYMGLGTKCFEILENRTPTGSAVDNGMGGIDESEEVDEDSDDSESVDADEMDDADDSLDAEMSDDDDDDDESEGSNGSGWEGTRAGRKTSPKLRLQEILFYDKVSIFKARHGRL